MPVGQSRRVAVRTSGEPSRRAALRARTRSSARRRARARAAGRRAAADRRDAPARRRRASRRRRRHARRTAPSRPPAAGAAPRTGARPRCPAAPCSSRGFERHASERPGRRARARSPAPARGCPGRAGPVVPQGRLPDRRACRRPRSRSGRGRLAKRLELDPGDPIGIVKAAPFRHAQREPRLAGAARPEQRHHPMVAQGAASPRRLPARGRQDAWPDAGRGEADRLPRRRGGERGILLEDRAMQLVAARSRARCRALRPALRGRAVHLERVGLPARAVEGEHQLAAEPLAERVLRTSASQLARRVRRVGRARGRRRSGSRARRAGAPRADRSSTRRTARR